jgi:hypothetical protein
MRDPVNVFYYPDMIASGSTLKKAILFFDEIHFMDRASFFFGGGQGQIGTIGAASPLRQYEDSFRENGVPLFVHPAASGPLQSEALELVASDINDHSVLSRYQEGLNYSQGFRDLQIAHGNYGQSGTHEDLAKQLISEWAVSREALRSKVRAVIFNRLGEIRDYSFENQPRWASDRPRYF